MSDCRSIRWKRNPHRFKRLQGIEMRVSRDEAFATVMLGDRHMHGIHRLQCLDMRHVQRIGEHC